jgi:hypothetical protein
VICAQGTVPSDLGKLGIRNTWLATRSPQIPSAFHASRGALRRGAEKTGRAHERTKGAATLHRESRDLGGPHVAFSAIVGTDGGTGPGAASCDLHTRC